MTFGSCYSSEHSEMDQEWVERRSWSSSSDPEEMFTSEKITWRWSDRKEYTWDHHMCIHYYLLFHPQLVISLPFLHSKSWAQTLQRPFIFHLQTPFLEFKRDVQIIFCMVNLGIWERFKIDDILLRNQAIGGILRILKYNTSQFWSCITGHFESWFMMQWLFGVQSVIFESIDIDEEDDYC